MSLFRPRYRRAATRVSAPTAPPPVPKPRLLTPGDHISLSQEARVEGLRLRMGEIWNQVLVPTEQLPAWVLQATAW